MRSHKMTTLTQNVKKKHWFVRFLNMDTSGSKGSGDRLPLYRQLLIQLLCLLITAEVMFPIMYIITLSLSPSGTRPSSLELFPKEISFVAFQQVLTRPTANPVDFLTLLKNSGLLSITVGAVSLLIAVSAAYAFSRFRFKLRQVLMIMVFIPLLMPAVGLSTPLFLLFNSFRLVNCPGGVTALYPFTSCTVGEVGKVIFNLRDSLLGVGIAMISTALPFAVLNLKGYLDTIPKELKDYLVRDYMVELLKRDIESHIVMPDSKWARRYARRDDKYNRRTMFVKQGRFPFETEIALYGKDRVAFISFREGDFTGVVIENQAIYNTLAAVFELLFGP